MLVFCKLMHASHPPEVIIHSLTLRRPILKLPHAHTGMVGGLCWSAAPRDTSRRLISCGAQDGTVKIWQSRLIAGHLSRTTQNGAEDEDGALEEMERNPFARAGEAAGRLEDEEQRGLEDVDLEEEEEGGGLNMDQGERSRVGEKIEVGGKEWRVAPGRLDMKRNTARHDFSGQEWVQVRSMVISRRGFTRSLGSRSSLQRHGPPPHRPRLCHRLKHGANMGRDQVRAVGPSCSSPQLSAMIPPNPSPRADPPRSPPSPLAPPPRPSPPCASTSPRRACSRASAGTGRCACTISARARPSGGSSWRCVVALLRKGSVARADRAPCPRHSRGR